jgi:hypothetical protein
VRIKSDRARVAFRRFAKEQPGAAIATGVAVAAVVGVTVWLIVRAVVDDK